MEQMEVECEGRKETVSKLKTHCSYPQHTYAILYVHMLQAGLFCSSAKGCIDTTMFDQKVEPRDGQLVNFLLETGETTGPASS